MKWLAYVVLAVVAASALAAGDAPARRRRPPPSEYGRVVIPVHPESARLPPVVFDHWLHRASYTCRVCHVDIGFAMRAGATGITQADNTAGQYCGTCHDGKRQSESGKRIFASCTKAVPGDDATCLRCHSLDKDVKPQHDFVAFAKDLPRERFGNGIDWEKAEQQKKIRPSDFLEGVSIKRAALPAQKDFALTAKLEGMPKIIFSHAKHTVWNGCELCHPDLFAVGRGKRNVTMVQIFEGQYCGACHASVAFPLTDCQRCHSEPVQPSGT